MKDQMHLTSPAAMALRAPEAVSGPTPLSQASARDLQSIVRANANAVWRFLRRMLPECDVDDALQEVVLITARKLERITEGNERAFMMGAAYRVAIATRRRRARRSEVSDETLPSEVEDPTPDAELLLAQKQSRELLELILEGMPFELRAVFVLFEIDGVASSEIALTLGLPHGTVASRLRRAREYFQRRVARISRSQGGET
jgi:RNA polymerase sigma-70 factor, ECF subfamily